MPTLDERIDFRCQSQQKDIIQEAATILGQSVSDFVVSTMVERSMNILQQSKVIQLSRRDAEKFYHAVFTDEPKVGPVLKRAAAKFKRDYPE